MYKSKINLRLSVHRDATRDTGSMQHTNTFILNTFIKKLHSWHTKNTSPLLYGNLVIGIFENSFLKNKSYYFLKYLGLLVIVFSLYTFHTNLMYFQSKRGVSSLRYLVPVCTRILISCPNNDPSSGSKLVTTWYNCSQSVWWFWLKGFDRYYNRVYNYDV